MDQQRSTEPIEAYQALLDGGEIKPDPSQKAAMEKLQGLHEGLLDYQPQMGKNG